MFEQKEEVAVVPETKTRYSDSELAEFQLLIDAKLEKAGVSLNYLLESFKGTSINDTKDTSPTFKWATEEGGSGLSKEDIGKQIFKQKTFIQDLKNASNRIKNKTYGICSETGKLIPKDRLRAVPHATLAIEAKLNRLDKGNINGNIHQLPRPSVH